MTSLRSRFTSASWKGKQRASPSDSDSYSKEQERGYRDAGSGGRVGRRDGLSGVEGDGGEDGIVLPLDMVGGGFYEACVQFPNSITFLLFFLSFVSTLLRFCFLRFVILCLCSAEVQSPSKPLRVLLSWSYSTSASRLVDIVFSSSSLSCSSISWPPCFVSKQ